MLVPQHGHTSNANKARQTDAAIAEQIMRTMRSTFHQVLGASLAAAPRLLKHTIEVAIAYGINVEKEPHYLWLADLALSLPVPAGWVRIDEGGDSGYWYNELAGTSQWAQR